MTFLFAEPSRHYRNCPKREQIRTIPIGIASKRERFRTTPFGIGQNGSNFT
jgi:hypothetical protein